MAYGLSKLRSRRRSPKERPEKKKKRYVIPRKARFKLYDNPLKPYRLQPTEDIRRKAEECRARQIAAENPVELWFAGILNQLGVKFQYQVMFYRVGSFICVDFICPEHKVAFEVDGEAYHQGQEGYDNGRDRWLLTQGYRTIRFKAKDVFKKRTDTLLRVKAELGR